MDETIKKMQTYLGLFALCFGLYGTFANSSKEAVEKAVHLENRVIQLEKELDEVHKKVDNTTGVISQKIDKMETLLNELLFQFTTYKVESETREKFRK